MNDINTIIDDNFLDSLEPCKDRYDLYKKHYAGKSFSVEEFVELNDIDWEDKLYVIWHGKFLTIKEKVEFGLDFAGRALHIYEGARPEDNRPRAALEAALNGRLTHQIVGDALAASIEVPLTWSIVEDDLAVADSSSAFIDYAAYSAGCAAYNAAYAACNFACDSSSAVIDYAAYRAVYSAYRASSSDSSSFIMEFQVREILNKIKDKHKKT